MIAARDSQQCPSAHARNIGANYVNTVGVIAEKLKAPLHKVSYVIRTRRIEPQGRAGNVRVFSDVATKRIAAEIRRIARRNSGIGK